MSYLAHQSPSVLHMVGVVGRVMTPQRHPQPDPWNLWIGGGELREKGASLVVQW